MQKRLWDPEDRAGEIIQGTAQKDKAAENIKRLEAIEVKVKRSKIYLVSVSKDEERENGTEVI